MVKRVLVLVVEIVRSVDTNVVVVVVSGVVFSSMMAAVDNLYTPRPYSSAL